MSQRHKLELHSYTAADEIIAQGAVAPAYLLQLAGGPASVSSLRPIGGPMPPGQGGGSGEPRIPGAEDLVVPMGPAGGPLQGSSLAGPLPESVVPPPEPTPPPDPDSPPVLDSIDPISVHIGGPQVTLTCYGSNFGAESVIVFNGGIETTQFISDTELTTVVEPETATVVTEVPVLVRTGDKDSEPIPFAFLEAETPEPPPEEPETPPEESGGATERILPLGPFTLSRIDDDPDGLALTIDGSPDIRVGDTLLIEATGNTSVNGEYAVINIDPIVVDNPYELAAPIEGKGRVTVS